MKISKYFTLREVGKSSTADRLGIDNTPTVQATINATDLALYVLDPVREYFGVPFSPQSWFRCEVLEQAITVKGFAKWLYNKGLLDSDETWGKYFKKKSHPKGEAADIEIPGVDNDKLFEWIRDNLEFDQLIREFRKEGDPMSGWVHVSFRKGHNRQQAFTIG